MLAVRCYSPSSILHSRLSDTSARSCVKGSLPKHPKKTDKTDVKTDKTDTPPVLRPKNRHRRWGIAPAIPLPTMRANASKPEPMRAETIFGVFFGCQRVENSAARCVPAAMAIPRHRRNLKDRHSSQDLLMFIQPGPANRPALGFRIADFHHPWPIRTVVRNHYNIYTFRYACQAIKPFSKGIRSASQSRLEQFK